MNDLKTLHRNQLLIVVIILLYLLSIISFYFGFWHQLQEQRRLEQLIETENRNQAIFNKIIKQRKEFENTISMQQQINSSYEQQIPQNQHLPLVLDAIKELAGMAEVSLNDLRYFPLKNDNDMLNYWFPIYIDVTGHYESLEQFFDNFCLEIPSLQINSLSINAISEGNLRLLLEFYLYVIPLEWETAKNWEKPVWQLTDKNNLPNRFGIPLSIIQDYHSKGLQLLGVVLVQERGQALISYQGSEEWKSVGDYVGPGRIIKIERSKVSIDLGGFKIFLSMGG